MIRLIRDIFIAALFALWSTPTLAAAHNGNCDVFLVIGQSQVLINPDGSPPASGAPTFSTNKAMYWTGSALANLSGQGGPMPNFGYVWYSATGRMAIIVDAAVASTTLLAVNAQGFGDWSPTGTLRAAALTQLTAALAYIAANNICNPFINAAGNPSATATLIALGESDAKGINGGSGATQAQLLSGWQGLFTYIRAASNVASGIYMFQTGTDPNQADAGFATVRASQAQVANPADSSTFIIFQTVNFQAFGIVDSTDSKHYGQIGWNIMGSAGAVAIRTFFNSIGL